MPFEQRLHPATLLFEIAKHARNLAIPAIFVILGMSRSTGGPGGNFARMPAGWEVWLLVLFVPVTLLSIARYISFRLRYDERELVIRSGIFFRNERRIPFSRIQNVDAVQNLFHRLFGVVEVRIETGGGKEEEARLSVLPHAAFLEMRRHVFQERSLETEHVATETPGETLLHLPPRELLLCGILENKGMILIGAAFGGLWESGLLRNVADLFGAETVAFGRGYFRDLATAVFEDGPFPFARVGLALAAIAGLLLFVRILSMLWAFMRLYDFRLTRIGEDLRSEYGLFTKVAATVPLRRVQALTISAGPLHRLLKRATVRVATAGGAGKNKNNQGATQGREWLAPLISQEKLPALLGQVVPGFDFDTVTWQPVHPRAFARAVKPSLLFSGIVSLVAAFLIGWASIGVAVAMLLWSLISTRQYVTYLGWAESDEVVMMRSGWLWRQITLARVNKIQAVRLHESPFDRLAAMAGVRVDTAGAGEFSHRVDIPYLDRDLAGALAGRLAAAAAHTTFRW